MIFITDYKLGALVSVTGRSALATVIAGFVFGITSLIMNLTWQGYYDNQSLAQIMNVQWLANIVLVMILTAAISITLSGPWIKDLKISIVPGYISGFLLVITAVFFAAAATLVQMSPIFVSRYSDGATMFDYFVENPIGYFGGLFAAGGYIIIVYSLIAAIIVGIIGLVYWSMISNRGKSHIKAIATILAAMLIVLVIPPAIGLTGLRMGLIEKSWNEYYEDYINSITVSRSNENTIYINYTGSSDLQLDSQMPILISINGKNATNMEAIRQSGLNASISPAEGLKNIKGASVELTGSDLMPVVHQEADYTFNSTHVTIVYVRYDGERDVVYDTVV